MYHLYVLYDHEVLVEANVVLRGTVTNKFSYIFELDNATYWNVRNIGKPYLYKFTVELKQGYKELDYRIVNFGIRTL